MKNSPYFKIIIFGIIALCLIFLVPNIPYFQNKRLKELENENKNLHKEIDGRNKHIAESDSAFKKLKNENVSLVKEIDIRNVHINVLEHKIDSINGLIETSDSTIIKIKNNGYEEINNVNNWDVNQRLMFFSDYFKGYNSKP